MIFVAGFLTAVLLYVVGSIMERRELAERERQLRARWGRDEQPSTHCRPAHRATSAQPIQSA